MRLEERNRGSAPGYALVAIGLGTAAIAAGRLLPADVRLVSYLLIPAVTLGCLWLATSRLPAAPDGTRGAGYGLVAVLGGATVLGPLPVIVGPVRVLAVALLVLGLRQLDLRQIVPALIVAFAPIQVTVLDIWSGPDATVVGGQVVAAAAFVAAGTWGMRVPGRTGGDVRLRPTPTGA